MEFEAEEARQCQSTVDEGGAGRTSSSTPQACCSGALSPRAGPEARYATVFPGAKGQKQWEPRKATVLNMALLIPGALGNDLDATSSLESPLVLTGMGQVQDIATPLCHDQRPTGCAGRSGALGGGQASLPSMKPSEALCPSRTLVDAVLHPRFLAELPCPEAQLDLLALAEELQQEEGLSLAQLEQKRLLELKQEEGVRGPPSHGTPRADSRPSGPVASQDPQRHSHGPQVERPSGCGRISACGDDFRRRVSSAGPARAVNLGSFASSFTVLPSAPPVLGPPHWAPWQQHPPNLLGPVLPPGSTLVLPAFPSTSLVARQASCGSGWPGACNITVHVWPEQRPVQAPLPQTFVVTRAPLHGSTPGALCGGAVCPVPQFLAASGVKTILPAPPAWSTQASDGRWSLHRPPRAAVPAAQLASGGLPAMASPRPPGAARSSGLACSQPTASPGNACTGTSVYEKFHRWQHYKPLARRHLPQTPDAEALSCFLMFMEFEAEEARHCQNAQWMKAAQGVPHPAPLRPVPRVPSAPERGQKRGMPPCSPGAKGQRQWEPGKAAVPNTVLLIPGALGSDLDATSSVGSPLDPTGMGQV
ncbi:Nut Family Member 2B [Manis pentadactyla]|nr:Nut Family Member 2B [Manis pentadactyla]